MQCERDDAAPWYRLRSGVLTPHPKSQHSIPKPRRSGTRSHPRKCDPRGVTERFGIVVTTLGRIAPLERLLDSLDGQVAPGDRIVLVAQHDIEGVRTVVTRHPGLPVTVTTSDRGASLGRNVGVAALPAGEDDNKDGHDSQASQEYVLMFPNDTTWFPPDTLPRLRASVGALTAAGALTVTDEHGPKFTLPAPGTPLTPRTVWSVIEMGLVIRSEVFRAVGGFDASIGTGAPTPWQAGEVTDLLLRLRRDRPEAAAHFIWLPSDIAVGGIADAHGLTASERRHKLRGYARGLGRLVARWHYPFGWRLAFTLGGLAFGLRHRCDYAPIDGWWVFLGRVEGWCNRTIGATATPAVRR